MNEKKNADVRVMYDGAEYRLYLGIPCWVEQANGELLTTGMPSIHLADPKTGELYHGLSMDIPEAQLKPGQVLVCGREEGLRALTEAGVVRFTGQYYRSAEFNETFPVCDLLMTAPWQEREQAKANSGGNTPSRGQLLAEQTSSGSPQPTPEKQQANDPDMDVDMDL
jgi:hypothetical protein